MIRQFFKKSFHQFLQEQEEEIIAKLCFWIVYYYISVPKHMVNASGILVHMNETHKRYSYDTIGDFLWEYSGKTRGTFYFKNRIYYSTFEEMIREKCREIIYAHYFPRFIEGHSLLCNELLREVGVGKTEMECGSSCTLIFNHCVETKDWIDEYEENVLKELCVLSLSFVVQAYGINVCKYIKQEDRQKIEYLVH